ncbi:MAG: polyphosphate kinase 1 [SAR324 cluster bacterium]|nr:polyphosphate kinase 1 [SAR324 cluster bacterium]
MSKNKTDSANVLIEDEILSSEDLNDSRLYFNRELSWLEFNQRVLEQAKDENHPLLERVKFLAIVQTNMDEFFMVRVAALLKQMRSGSDNIAPDGMSVEEQLGAIRSRVQQMKQDQQQCWSEQLRPQLEKHSVRFIEPDQYTPELREYLSNYYQQGVHPVLTPLAFDPGHPFPFISSMSLNLAVVVQYGPHEKNFARIKIPDVLPRFIPVPEELAGSRFGFVYLEDVIKDNLKELFPDNNVLDVYVFRVIRDTDLVIQEDEAGDLLENVDRSLKQLRYGNVSLLQVEDQMPEELLQVLMENFEIERGRGIVTRTHTRMNFGAWFSLLKLSLPQLKDAPFKPSVLFTREQRDTIFDRIRLQDYLVHHPFESFDSVEEFISAAVKDPHVIGIKMTLYRVGSDSQIVQKLIEAAEDGKQVAVLVELKARFDEKNNIVWARRLESVGAHVVYGMLKLKTHCKLCMVIRKEGDRIRRYMHIGTGNYNPGSSKIYTDLGIFTASEQIGRDVTDVFNYLTGYSGKHDYDHLLVAPRSLRRKLEEMIDREAEIARSGKEGRIIIKANAVTHPSVIQALYRASQAGVKIDLIIRGICCLRPGLKNISENIRVRSIIGRFLEHSRLFYFKNDGSEEMYIGSADIMERNLDRRVEVLTPILEAQLRQVLMEKVLQSQLKDNQLSFELLSDGNYKRIRPEDLGEVPYNSQTEMLQAYSEASN